MTRREYISRKLSEASLYEQLAEECSELCHASLKVARFLRKENPIGMEKISDDANPLVDLYLEVAKEFADVMNAIDLINEKSVFVRLDPEEDVVKRCMEMKIDRWFSRLYERDI